MVVVVADVGAWSGHAERGACCCEGEPLHLLHGLVADAGAAKGAFAGETLSTHILVHVFQVGEIALFRRHFLVLGDLLVEFVDPFFRVPDLVLPGSFCLLQGFLVLMLQFLDLGRTCILTRAWCVCVCACVCVCVCVCLCVCVCVCMCMCTCLCTCVCVCV